jgi:hypothetical protein
VLQRATPDEEQAIVGTMPAALDALTTFLTEGAEKAMHRLHSRTPGDDGGSGNNGNGNGRNGAVSSAPDA